MTIESPIVTEELELIPGSTTHSTGFVPVVRVVCRETEFSADVAIINVVYSSEEEALMDARDRAQAMAGNEDSLRHALCLPPR